MYLFLKLYIISILLINNNIYFFNKYKNISIILLRATWNGNNDGNDNNEGHSNNDNNPPYTCEIPTGHMMCDTRPNIRGIAVPPDSPTPITANHIQNINVRRSGRIPSPDEIANIPPPQYILHGSDTIVGPILEEVNDIPPPPYSPENIQHNINIPYFENIDTLFGEGFQMNAMSIRSNKNKSYKKKSKLYKQIQSVIEKISTKYIQLTSKYLKTRDKYMAIVAASQDRNCEEAKNMRKELRIMYSCLLDYIHSYEYHNQCLKNLE